MTEKVFHYKEDREKLEHLLAEGKSVLVGGCFDILHYGHLMFLKKAREAGERLVVALEPDGFVREKKKKEPVHTQAQRAEILSHIDVVDIVICLPLLSEDKDYYELVQFVHPAVIAYTKGDSYAKYKKEQAIMAHAQVVEIDHYEGFSSSAIKHYAALSGN